MHLAAFAWNVLYVSIKFIWSTVLFKANVPLFISYLDDLSTDLSGLSPLLQLYCQFLPLCFLIFALYIFWCFHDGWIYILKCCISFWGWPLYHYVMPFFYYSLCFKVYFISYEYSYTNFLFVSRMEYHFPSLPFILCVSLLLKSASCRQAHRWVFLKIINFWFQYRAFWLDNLIYLHLT